MGVQGAKHIRKFEEIYGLKRVPDFVGFMTIYARRNFDAANFDQIDYPAVKLLTIHQAKGLEFDAVFCPMLVKGRFPVSRSKPRSFIPDDLYDSKRYIGDVEDERRMFYVALTRAKHYLSVSCPEDIGQKRKRAASAFFVESEAAKIGKNMAIAQHEKKKPPRSSIETSFSSLEYYFTCPYRYLLRIECNILPPDNPFFQYGQAIHHVLKIIHEKYLAGERLDEKRILKLYETNFYMRPTVPKHVITKNMISGRRSILTYFSKNVQTFDRILCAEKEFELFFDLDRIIGRFDLVKKSNGDSIEIIDFKTGSPKEYLHSDLQMRLYAVAARNRFNRTVEKCSLYYIEKDTVKDIPITEKILDDTQELMRKTINGIKNEDFTARPGEPCVRCEYRNVCQYRKKCD